MIRNISLSSFIIFAEPEIEVQDEPPAQQDETAQKVVDYEHIKTKSSSGSDSITFHTTMDYWIPFLTVLLGSNYILLQMCR